MPRSPGRGSARPCRRRRRSSACRRPARRPTPARCRSRASRRSARRARRRPGRGRTPPWRTRRSGRRTGRRRRSRGRGTRSPRRSASPPSRLRRISSWGITRSSTKRSISGPSRAAALLGDAQRLLVAELLAAHALGEVGDGAHRGDAQARVAGGDHLGHGAHPDEVGAERAERADLGRRLEARARDREVDAVVQLGAERVGGGVQAARAARGRRRRAGWGSAGRRRRRSGR